MREIAINPWKKHGLYLQWVEELRQKLGLDRGRQVGPLIGLGVPSMEKTLIPSGYRPGVNALKALGDLVGKDYRLLLEDPAIPPGFSEIEWQNLEKTKVDVLKALASELTPIPPEQQDLIASIFLRAIREAAETGRLIQEKARTGRL